VLSNKNLVANIMQIHEHEDFDGSNSFVTFLPYYHIYGITIITLYGLFTGSFMFPMQSYDFEKYLHYVSEKKATVLHVVPPVCINLAKSPLVDKYNFNHVRFLFSAAAPLSHEIETALQKRLGVDVRHGYGMTELSPICHLSPYMHHKVGSVGKLVSNCEAKVISLEDDSGDVGSLTGEGELCIRGPNVMKGYLNNEKATENTIDKYGFVKTGDIVRVDEDGYCFILDRKKELIKYKGFQVAPAELEGVLLSHPNVADCCVVGKKDYLGGELPTAFVVFKEKKSTSIEELSQFVNETVAPYKQLRGGIHMIDSIPKTASGKLLRRILRDSLN